MSKAEKKIIAWVNGHMVLIAFAFVLLAAVWMRLGGRKYVGIDYHFSLYDIPGNCNPFVYRKAAEFLMTRWLDSAIVLLKIAAYVGDFGVALLTLLLLHRTRSLSRLQAFLVVTACLLSPVSLLYSVGGMEIDALCMCFLLLGLLLCQADRMPLSIPVMAIAAFISAAYWPVVILLAVYMVAQQRKRNRFGAKTIVSLALLLCLLILSVVLENVDIANGYYWGKIFVIDPATGVYYAGVGEWLQAMCRIYGYFCAVFCLFLSFWHRRLRIPALALQILVLMSVGWYQTSHFAI